MISRHSFGRSRRLALVAFLVGVLVVLIPASNVNAEGSSVTNDRAGDLAVFSQDYTHLSAVPPNMCLARDVTGNAAPQNLALSYDGAGHCVKLAATSGAVGRLLVGGLSPSLVTTITLDMGMGRTQEDATVNVYAGGAWLAVQLRGGPPAGTLRITSKYYTYSNPTLRSATSDTPGIGLSDSARFKITIASDTVSRTNTIYLNDVAKLTTPYTGYRASSLLTAYDPFVNPFVHFDFASIGSGKSAYLHLYSVEQTVPKYSYVTPVSDPRQISFGVDLHPWNTVKAGLSLLDGGTIWADVGSLNRYSSSDLAALKALIADGFELGIHFSKRLEDLSLADAIALMNRETAEISATFGQSPASWCGLQGADNVTHAEYAYIHLGMVSRNGVNGSAAGLSSVGNLADNCWAFWRAASAAGIVIPSFSHQLDVTPAIDWSITAANFRTFVSNYAGNGVRFVGFREYWQEAQNSHHTAISNVVSDPGVSLSFTVRNMGGKSRLLVNAPWADVVRDGSGNAVPFEPCASGILIEAEDGDYTVLTAAGPPQAAVTTTAATGIGATTATLNGNLTSLGADTSVQVSFDWGPTTSYGHTTTPQTMTTAGAFSFPLTGLAPAATYHFRAKVVESSTSYGSDRTFATSGAGSANIVLDSLTCSPANPVPLGNRYTLTATLQNSGGAAGTATVVFGWTSGTARYTLSTQTVAVGAGSTVTATYSRATSAKGAYTMYCKVGAVERTATLIVGSVTSPAATTAAATGVGGATATLNGNLTSLGADTSVQVSFDWGPTTSYGHTTTPQTMTTAGAFSFPLTGLAPAATYHFRAKVVGSSTSYGSDRTFATSGAGSADIVLDSFTCSPANPVPLGNRYTLTATLQNSGGAAGTATVVFGWTSGTARYTLSTQTVAVGAGSTITATYSRATSAKGAYTMYCKVSSVEKTATLVVA